MSKGSCGAAESAAGATLRMARRNVAEPCRHAGAETMRCVNTEQVQTGTGRLNARFRLYNIYRESSAEQQKVGAGFYRGLAERERECHEK